MYLLKNKPLEISSWYYQANGGKTEFILDSSEYKKLSIGQYDVTAYDPVVIRISASTYVKGTVSNFRLW